MALANWACSDAAEDDVMEEKSINIRPKTMDFAMEFYLLAAIVPLSAYQLRHIHGFGMTCCCSVQKTRGEIAKTVDF